MQQYLIVTDKSYIVYLDFRPTALFRVYELIGCVLSRYSEDHYYYPSQNNQYWTLLGFKDVSISYKIGKEPFHQR